MIDANAIRNNIEAEFKANFDFTAFDNYINDFFVTKRRNYLQIGLDDDYRFKTKSNPILMFEKGHTNYIWTTNIQINRRFAPYVEKYLNNNGFTTYEKGACGYDEKDIIVVSI